MKRTFRTALLCGAALFLMTLNNSIFAEASDLTEGTLTGTADEAAGLGASLGKISDAYMPRIDALTFVSENSIHMPEAGEYTNMIVADVTDFVNVRTEPDTESGIVGRIYDNAAAKVIKFSPVDDTWLEITSGDVTGYVKAEYFLFGTAASESIEEMIQNGDTLTYARSMNDILAEIAAQEKAKEEARKAAEEARRAEAQKAAVQAAGADTVSSSAAEATASGTVTTEDATATGTTATESTATGTTTSADLRQNIVDFAMQYLGGPYKHGGNSLTEGTDCSGFTSLIFAEFGYSLSRTPSGQLSSDGTKIEYSEIQPGDIICYTSNGKTCTHVALYIGDGLIIHAANSKKGIIINDAGYSTIMGVKRIIE